MKKLFVIFTMCICITIFTCSVWAETPSTGTSTNGDKVEIAFKVGDETLKINQKDVTVEKPFVKNGVTLVPLRVITEAFGAEVVWNDSDKSISLKYKDVIIRLVVNNKEALVDAKKSTLLEAPVIVNGKTMVPLRFITENFGADVTYDSKTAMITVLKEIANGNSIKDFGLILKKTTKNKVGDSFYNWSMALPSKIKISDRDFNGTYNRFTAEDESYFLDLYISKLKDETLDSILADEIGYAKDYTILEQGIQNKNGQQYVKCVSKSEKYVIENRTFISNNRIYAIDLYVTEYSTYKNNKDLSALLDSFDFQFAKDGSVEDLSDLNSNGLRPYENKKFKFSLLAQPEWEESKDDDKQNLVDFISDNNRLGIQMYSIENGLTLDKWVEDEQKDAKEKYNQDLLKVLKVEEGSINNIPCKKVYVSLSYNGTTIYGCDVYMMGKNYRYDVAYSLKAEDYDNNEIRTKYENAINSFKFSEPDIDEIGPLVDPDKINVAETLRKIENTEYKWSFQIPSSWTAGSGNNGSTEAAYMDKDEHVVLSFFAMKEVPFNDFFTSFEKQLESSSTLPNTVTIDTKENINDKGTTVRKYLITSKSGNIAVKQIVYMLNKNGYTYLAYFITDNLYWCDKNIKTMESIWNSAKFE